MGMWFPRAAVDPCATQNEFAQPCSQRAKVLKLTRIHPENRIAGRYLLGISGFDPIGLSAAPPDYVSGMNFRLGLESCRSGLREVRGRVHLSPETLSDRVLTSAPNRHANAFQGILIGTAHAARLLPINHHPGHLSP